MITANQVRLGSCMILPLLLWAHNAKSSSLSLPTRENVLLFKAIAPKMVNAIPDSALKPSLKDKLSQVIIAGSDIFDLALAIDSGEFTQEFKETLNTIRNEFRTLNTKLVAESKKIQEIKAQLKNAVSAEQRAALLEQQISLMLTMFTSMADPMNSISSAFNELNQQIFSKLLNVIEIIPPVAPYLMVGSQGDTVTLSRFMHVKLQEMIKYTDALKKIGNNLTLAFDELKSDMRQCKQELTNSLVKQKALLQQSAKSIKTGISPMTTELPMGPELQPTELSPAEQQPIGPRAL